METEHPFLTDCNVATFFLSYAIATTSDDRVFLRKLKCHYVVLDEGHMLKNMQSQRYQGLMKVKVGVLCSFSIAINYCARNIVQMTQETEQYHAILGNYACVVNNNIATIGDFLPPLHAFGWQNNAFTTAVHPVIRLVEVLRGRKPAQALVFEGFPQQPTGGRAPEHASWRDWKAWFPEKYGENSAKIG